MVFSSFAFLFVFLPVTIGLYYSLPWRVARNWVLLLAGIFFYAWGEPVYVLLMLASTLLNWRLALQMDKSPAPARGLLILGIAGNLAGIAVFKYADFLLRSTCFATGREFRSLGIALPIGISFYTFQAISYLMDVYRRQVAAQPSLAAYGTYHTLFPQMIAGPVVRYATVADELFGRRESMGEVAEGIRRFCQGFAKKILIANPMGQVADTLLDGDPAIGAIPAWVGVVAYAVQIYFDFSGYSDMAIGLGRMFGFRFLENFQHPYVARSVSEFWRRWHISLSTFFRDYVYLPMGGSRVSRPRLVVNLLVVWALTGLWHGASWNFVLWGAYYGVLLAGEKLLWGGLLGKLPALFRHAYTIAAFLLGWVLFRVTDTESLQGWYASLAGLHGAGDIALLNALNVAHLWPWLVVAAVFATPGPARWMEKLAARRATAPLGDILILAAFLLALATLIGSSYNPFIYFRF